MKGSNVPRAGQGSAVEGSNVPRAGQGVRCGRFERTTGMAGGPLWKVRTYRGQGRGPL